jgi:anaerobic magnesium-protoporphyrin IX monomethyl ester cyclase
MNKNILLIYPEVIESRVFDRMPPLGLAWIAAVLRSAGYDPHILDCQVDDRNPAKVAEELRPTLTLIGGTSHSRFAAFVIAERIKQSYPSTTVVYGGPHASFTAEDTLTHIPAIDIVVHGEGEKPARELARWASDGGNPASIKGISYRLNGNIVSTGWAPAITDLDSLPLPARDLLPIPRYEMKLEYLGLPALNLITARGCPIACSFCSASRMFGRSYAMRSPKLVVDEIEGLVQDYGIKGLKIFDSTFTLNRSHVLGFCDELIRRGLVMPWECEVRVGSVDEAMLTRMQEAGCYYIDVGVESGDQDTLDGIGKSIRLADAGAMLEMARRLGIRSKAFFTVGHIGETYEMGRKTLGFIRRNRGRITTVGYNPSIRIYPGTKVEDYAQELGLMPAGFSWSLPYENRDNVRLYRPVDNIPILLQPQMGLRELRKLRNRYIRGRLLSPRFWVWKLGLLIRHRELGKYVGLGVKGSVGKKK